MPCHGGLDWAGVALVTHASGKSRGVVFRWARNKTLRSAFTCFADNSRHASGWAVGIYARARQDGVTYDPTRHTPAARIA